MNAKSCPWCDNPPKIMQSETGAWYAVSTCSKPECGHHTAASYATEHGAVTAWNAIMETRMRDDENRNAEAVT